MSVRTYKLMAAGGFVLANYHADMERWIPCVGNDKVLDYYKSIDECLEKIHYYLEHPTEREAIARRGQQWAAKQTYTERMRLVRRHIESGRYYFHHYIDVKDFDKTVEQMKTLIRGTEERRYVATVATNGCLSEVRALITSLRMQDYKDDVVIFTLADEEQELKRVFEGEATVVGMDPWYDKFIPQKHFNKGPRFLKPAIYNYFKEGDKVLFLDGSDIIVYGDVKKIFEELDKHPLILTPAEQDRDTILPNGYRELFGVEKITRYNSGVWAFQKSPRTDYFFRLWQAFCAWSLIIKHGDQAAFIMAANVNRDFLTFPREWNWLPAYETRWMDGKPFAPDGTPVVILHRAGEGPFAQRT